MNNNILSVKKNIESNGYPNSFYVASLNLKNFRSHNSLSMKIPDSSVLIYGENGCGKTNILEAISLLSQGKGLRKSKTEDFLFKSIELNKKQRTWGINADIVTPDGVVNIGTGLKENSQIKSRKVRVNSEDCSHAELGKILKISWITPQMCTLFQSGMSERRRFIDSLTSSLDPSHLSRVYKYKKLLRQRSYIILQFNSDTAWLTSIESQISELAVAITASRMDLVQALNDLFKEEYENKFLIDNFPPAEIKFKGEIEDLLLKKSALEVEDYIKIILKKSRVKNDLPLCGPHTSEIKIFNRKNYKPVEISSTGEQKLILISIILSHARMLNIKLNMAPILLLDDIVEHLDEKHRFALYQEVTRHCAQSWFTSTSKEAFKTYPNTINKIYLPSVIGDLNGYYDFKMEKI
ncbi:DNA replication/repair protein RecF [Alphaproteobacteria bacterium]|nr:DNA replication/repair protein RecF [Alphaproteobacteria bacterium]